jgi:hypothetical protein
MFSSAREFLQDEDRVKTLRAICLATTVSLYGFLVGSGLNFFDLVSTNKPVPISQPREISPRSTYVNVPAGDYLAKAVRAGVDMTPVCGHCGEAAIVRKRAFLDK